MFFSKSFGYAVRGVLYVAIIDKENSKVQLNEMADKLLVPRHFLAKIMKTMMKEGILTSTKGPYGGFAINGNTLQVTLIQLVKITDGVEQFNSCVLRLRKCNSKNPCPMHIHIESLRKQWQSLLASTTIGDLLRKDQPDFIKSIATL
ncbi:MAG: Rrf2 family transcriptional regulator [Bacteroidota bacterium]|nr:Rrf2 family transcriptional regulator [Bacteroidota bacterium]